ncbi:TRAP transporter small permease subunit [Psychromarinibacter halotolerans]|uniref:TRAP transporter small permease protein n=1 Tax=Psychromarinibacter halotolerans TaxID=1775175 RepID=A0ABV7GS47_9RHOB|nr:TRAP transporter small permease [Psychromarinibacter halotolerans]MDF0597634.1 TRAP transporter small permease [Psychromarinibacter halotolerans]
MAARSARLTPLGVVVDISNVIGVLLIWAVVVLMCLDVVSRNLLNQPIAGVADIVASSVVAIVFLQLGSAVRNDRLTRADFLLARIQTGAPGLAKILGILFHLIGAAICIGIVNWTLPKLGNAWTRSEFVGIVGVMTFPRWPVLAIAVYGAGLAAIQFLAHAVREALPRRAASSEHSS